MVPRQTSNPECCLQSRSKDEDKAPTVKPFYRSQKDHRPFQILKQLFKTLSNLIPYHPLPPQPHRQPEKEAYLKEIYGHCFCLMEWMINRFIQNPKCFKKKYAKVGKEKRKYKMKRGIWIPKWLWVESRLRKLLCYQENSGCFLQTRKDVSECRTRSPEVRTKCHAKPFQAAGLNIQWVWYITLHYLIHYIILCIILLLLKIVLNTYNIKFAIYPF